MRHGNSWKKPLRDISSEERASSIKNLSAPMTVKSIARGYCGDQNAWVFHIVYFLFGVKTIPAGTFPQPQGDG